jgi:hypothetical protein
VTPGRFDSSARTARSRLHIAPSARDPAGLAFLAQSGSGRPR